MAAVHDNALLAYAALFLGMFIEGEVLLSTALILAFHGALVWWVVLPVAATGVVAGDTLWWFAGHRAARTIDRLAVRIPWIRVADYYIRRRPVRTLTAIKFAYGLNRPTLLRTGSLGLPIGRFLSADIRAAACWAVTIGAINAAALYLIAALFPGFRIWFVILCVTVTVVVFSLWEARRLNARAADLPQAGPVS